MKGFTVIVTGLIVGVVLGVVMQRGRFCVTGMLRDVFLQKTYRGLVALLIVIAVHALGLATLTSLGVISPDYSTFAPAAVIIGGFIFGLSIILSGGCASGTWYRSAEGLVGSWIALLFYGLSAAAMKSGPLKGFYDWMKSWDTGWTTLPETFGISVWWFAIPFALVTFLAARHYLNKDAAQPKVSLNQPWYRKPMHMYLAGGLIGLIGVIAWPLSAATGRNSGLGITTPSAHVMSFTTTGNPEYLNWGTLLVVGLLVGAFIAAKVSGEFRVRVPDATTATRSVFGGIGMGVGAALAGGCTVGNGMVETSLFSYQGWIALAFMALGVAVGAKLWIKPVQASADQGTYSTEDSLRSAEDDVLDNSAATTDATATPANNPGGFQVATSLVNLKTPEKQVAKARSLGNGRYALDQMGQVCPFPLVEAKDVMTQLDDGDQLVIDFDCTQATESIPQWAADEGHAVIDFSQNQEAGWQITLAKNGS